MDKGDKSLVIFIIVVFVVAVIFITFAAFDVAERRKTMTEMEKRGIARDVDYEAGTVCYTYGHGFSRSIDCVPLDDTALQGK